MRAVRTILAALCLCTAVAAVARADSSAADCLSDDNERRIAGCTVIIENPATTPLDRSNALAMRGLALSIKGLLDRAIDDYNASLTINPNSALRAQQPRLGLLPRRPRPATACPTSRSRCCSIQTASIPGIRARTSARCWAMSTARSGTTRWPSTSAASGWSSFTSAASPSADSTVDSMDGIYSSEMKSAMHTCVRKRDCDPLPADEQCKLPMS